MLLFPAVAAEICWDARLRSRVGELQTTQKSGVVSAHRLRSDHLRFWTHHKSDIPHQRTSRRLCGPVDVAESVRRHTQQRTVPSVWQVVLL
jgi:hypothetical protein